MQQAQKTSSIAAIKSSGVFNNCTTSDADALCPNIVHCTHVATPETLHSARANACRHGEKQPRHISVQQQAQSLTHALSGQISAKIQ